MAATTASAAFQISQDAEKENPRHNIHLKEKITGKSNLLQPLGGSTMGGIPGIVGNQQQKLQSGVVSLKSGRANFAALKTNTKVLAAGGANNNNNNIHHHNNKMAFRDVGNVKNNIKDDQAPRAVKKPAIVPLEQFKTFSVYEDQDENEEQQKIQKVLAVTKKQATGTTDIETSSQDVVDKENVYREKQLRLQKNHILTESREINKYDLDATPMSVSDVLSLSPMSVDRSANVSQLFDDCNTKEIAETSEYDKKLPSNDRERFYEVVEYQDDILKYFRESEKKHRPKPHYMRRQTDINYSMRTILVDWLVEVSEEYNLDTETLYLSVSYIDRFLSHMSVVRNKLQLVGTTAIYIASKYEEIYPPEVAEFVFITDDTYNKAQVLRMEQIILKVLAFDLCTPTAYVFINTYAVLLDIPQKIKFLTLYISELSLLEADPYLRFHPSIISSAALGLARYLCGMPIWSSKLEEITTYRLEDLREVLLCLCKTHNAAVNLSQQAIQEKYKADKYRGVANIKPVTISEAKFDEIERQFNETLIQEQKLKQEQQQKQQCGGKATSAPSAKVNTFFKF